MGTTNNPKLIEIVSTMIENDEDGQDSLGHLLDHQLLRTC